MDPAIGSWALPLTMLAAGFASGVHCLGMCGGIVSAAPSRIGITRRAANAGCYVYKGSRDWHLPRDA